MDLTVDQALQKGIEAHKAGKAQEADLYYTAILKANPKHPDANHNMGVLAVGLGKIKEALPFFQTALEANPETAQFWLSCIDTLIKLNRIDDAKALLDQSRIIGAQGDSFDHLEQQLEKATIAINPDAKDTFSQALELRETGKYSEAIKLLSDDIDCARKNARFLSLLAHCYILNGQTKEASQALNKAKDIEPGSANIGWVEARLLLKKKCSTTE